MTHKKGTLKTIASRGWQLICTAVLVGRTRITTTTPQRVYEQSWNWLNVASRLCNRSSSRPIVNTATLGWYRNARWLIDILYFPRTEVCIMDKGIACTNWRRSHKVWRRSLQIVAHSITNRNLVKWQVKVGLFVYLCCVLRFYSKHNLKRKKRNKWKEDLIQKCDNLWLESGSTSQRNTK
jgi:hypothetical protein